MIRIDQWVHREKKRLETFKRQKQSEMKKDSHNYPPMNSDEWYNLYLEWCEKTYGYEEE